MHLTKPRGANWCVAGAGARAELSVNFDSKVIEGYAQVGQAAAGSVDVHPRACAWGMYAQQSTIRF